MFIADSSPYLSCHVLPQSCQVRFLPLVLLSTVKSCYLSTVLFRFLQLSIFDIRLCRVLCSSLCFFCNKSELFDVPHLGPPFSHHEPWHPWSGDVHLPHRHRWHLGKPHLLSSLFSGSIFSTSRSHSSSVSFVFAKWTTIGSLFHRLKISCHAP